MNQPTDIVFTNIWARDKLDRRGYADFLYKVIESAKTSEAEDNALIFAIDGEWGTGKSFFIECWIDDLRAKGHLVSRFDAWKNDIVDEPLIGFLSHIYADLGEWDNKDASEISGEKIKASQKILLPLAKELAKGAVIKGLGYLITDDTAKELYKNLTDGIDKVEGDQEKEEHSMAPMLMHRKLQAHNKNLQLIDDFKSKLSSVANSLVSDDARKRPVFIFIDELDRCRPDYAVRLLEVVKHIFNSTGICFISSVNIDQLQQSIKTIYGSDFKADQYLDRFFSHRLKLPDPSARDYINSLRVFNFVKDRKARLDAGSSLIREFNDDYVNYFSRLCEQYKYDLRTIKTIFNRLDICRNIINQDDDMPYHDEILFFILCYLKNNAGPKSNDPRGIFTSSNVHIGDCSYYFYHENGSQKMLMKSSWSNFFSSISEFYEKLDNPRRSLNSLTDHFYLYESLLTDMGGPGRSLRHAIATLQKYVDVCRMSGKLDS